MSRLRNLDLPRSLVVRRVVAQDNKVEIEVGLRRRNVLCPDCQCPTQRVHSFYQRKLADLPWQGRPATLIVSVPRFFCQTAGRTVYDWRHYLAVIQRKPGALRNGAPFTEFSGPCRTNCSGGRETIGKWLKS